MPWGIAVDREGDVYVSDWRNDRIQKFAPRRAVLMQFGTSGTGEGQFNRPSGVAVDQEGVIYVADWLNNRLQVFDPDGTFITLKTGDATLSKWAKDKKLGRQSGNVHRARARLRAGAGKRTSGDRLAWQWMTRTGFSWLNQLATASGCIASSPTFVGPRL